MQAALNVDREIYSKGLNKNFITQMNQVCSARLPYISVSLT